MRSFGNLHGSDILSAPCLFERPKLNPGVKLFIRNDAQLCLPDMALSGPPLREALKN